MLGTNLSAIPLLSTIAMAALNPGDGPEMAPNQLDEDCYWCQTYYGEGPAYHGHFLT